MTEQWIERRRLGRVVVDGRCAILAEDGRSISTTILDISPLGIAVEACESLQPNGTHMLALELHRLGRTTRINTLGKVSYVLAPGTGCRLGLEFVDMDACSRFHLNSLADQSHYQG